MVTEPSSGPCDAFAFGAVPTDVPATPCQAKEVATPAGQGATPGRLGKCQECQPHSKEGIATWCAVTDPKEHYNHEWEMLDNRDREHDRTELLEPSSRQTIEDQVPSVPAPGKAPEQESGSGSLCLTQTAAGQPASRTPDPRNTALLICPSPSAGPFLVPPAADAPQRQAASEFPQLLSFFWQRGVHVSACSTCSARPRYEEVLQGIKELFTLQAEFVSITLTGSELSDGKWRCWDGEVSLETLVSMKRAECTLFLLLDFPGAGAWAKLAAQKEYFNLVIQASNSGDEAIREPRFIERWLQLQEPGSNASRSFQGCPVHYRHPEQRLTRFFPSGPLQLLGENQQGPKTQELSVGSRGHPHKCEKPCNKYIPGKPGSCKHGASCRFCHEEHNRPTQKSQSARFAELKRGYYERQSVMDLALRALLDPIYTVPRARVQAALGLLASFKTQDRVKVTSALLDSIREKGEQVQLLRPVAIHLQNRDLPRVQERAASEAEVNERLKWYEGVMHTVARLWLSSNSSAEEVQSLLAPHLEATQEFETLVREWGKCRGELEEWCRQLGQLQDAAGEVPLWFVEKTSGLAREAVPVQLTDFLTLLEDLRRLAHSLHVHYLELQRNQLELCGSLAQLQRLLLLPTLSLGGEASGEIDKDWWAKYVSAQVLLSSWPLSRKRLGDYLRKVLKRFLFLTVDNMEETYVKQRLLELVVMVDRQLVPQQQRGCRQSSMAHDDEEEVQEVLLGIRNRVGPREQVLDLETLHAELREEFGLPLKSAPQPLGRLLLDQRCHWLEPILYKLVVKALDGVQEPERQANEVLFGQVLGWCRRLPEKLHLLLAPTRGGPADRAVLGRLQSELSQCATLANLEQHLRTLVCPPPGLH